MIPLTMAKVGDKNYIKKIGGNEATRRYLKSLGFVEGTAASVIAKIGGDVIVNIKESRVALSCKMANKIIVNIEKGV